MVEHWGGVRFSVLSNVKYLEPIRTVVRELTQLAGFDEEQAHEILLAVQEGCSNVIRHCYKSCPDERIDIVVRFQDDAFVIVIDDYGEFVDPKEMRGRELEDVRPGGLGLHLMRTVMDHVGYERNQWGGTTLTMRRRLPRAPEGGAERTVEINF